MSSRTRSLQATALSAETTWSVWAWSNPCCLSSVPPFPSPSCAMSLGSWSTCAATRTPRHLWKPSRRCVCACRGERALATDSFVNEKKKKNQQTSYFLSKTLVSFKNAIKAQKSCSCVFSLPRSCLLSVCWSTTPMSAWVNHLIRFLPLQNVLLS